METNDALLNQAAAVAREFRWMEAAGLYEQLIQGEVGAPPERRGDLQARYAYALFRAAFQAEDADTYRQLMRHARETAKEASALFDAAGLKAASAYYLAWSEWTEYFLSPERIGALSTLQRGLQLLDQAIGLYNKEGDTDGEGEALALWLEIAYWLSYSSSEPKRYLELSKAAEERVHRALAITDMGGKSGLRSRALAWFSYHLRQLSLSTAESRQEDSESAYQMADEAVRLSKEIDDPWIGFWPNIVAGRTGERVTSDTERLWSYATNALSYARSVRDNRLMAFALRQVVQMLRWQLVVSEDREKAEEIFRQLLDHLVSMKRHASLVPCAETSTQLTAILGDETQAHMLMAQFSADASKRRSLLETGIKQGVEGMNLSDHKFQRSYLAFALTMAHITLAAEESSKKQRRQILESAARYAEINDREMREAAPGFYWNVGIGQAIHGRVLYELAGLEDDSTVKKSFLERALHQLDSGIAVSLRETVLREGQLLRLGQLTEIQAKVLQALQNLGHDLSTTKSTTDVWRQAADFYARSGQTSRVAEAYWQMAEASDNLGDYSKAAEAFQRAAQYYTSLSSAVTSLKDFYNDYSNYMTGWVEIEKAKAEHENENYQRAAVHYSTAAELVGMTKRWSYLQGNFSAWAALEEAEDLSRQEKLEEAELKFTRAKNLFEIAESDIRLNLSKAATGEEKAKADELIRAIPLRKEYCHARAMLEQARVADRLGNEVMASQKYSSAYDIFMKLAEKLESERDRRELEQIAYLSKAWQKMAEAERKFSPSLYAEAAELFMKAKERATKEKLGLLATGNSYFCQALQNAAWFRLTRNLDLYSKAKLHMDNAAQFYSKAGFEKEADWAKATQRLFDAYVYMDSAQKDPDPDKKAKYYAMSEKVLQLAAELYEKSGFTGKRDEALKALQNVREEKEVALSLTEILKAPTVLTSTSSFALPAPTHEAPIGLERFEAADVQSSLIVAQREVNVGEDLPLELEMVNTGRAPALLVKVEELVPEGFEISSKPEQYRLLERGLDLKGRRLDPLKTEELKLWLKAKNKGTFSLKPRILFVDDKGRYRSQEPEAITITVKELGIAGWVRGPTK